MLSFGYEAGWGAPPIGRAATAVIATAVFVWHERRFDAALLDRTLFHDRISRSLVCSACAAVVAPRTA